MILKLLSLPVYWRSKVCGELLLERLTNVGLLCHLLTNLLN